MATGKSNVSRITITYSELIKICASMQLTQLAEYDQVQLMRLMIAFQGVMDYENLAKVLIKNDLYNLMHEFLRYSDLKKNNRRQAAIEIFKGCLRLDEMAHAIMIWKEWRFMLVDEYCLEQVSRAIIETYIKNAEL